MKNPAASYPHYPSFRTVLLAVLAAVALLLAQSSWRAYNTARAEIFRTEAAALHLADAVASHQQALLDHTAHLLRVLGGLSLPGNNDPAICGEFLARQLEAFPQYDNLAFADLNGAIKCSARSHPIILPAALAGLSAPPAEQPRLLSLSRDCLLFAVPHLAMDGRMQGWVVASLPVAKFFRQERSAAVHGAAFSLIDSGGRLVSEHPPAAAWYRDDPLFAQSMLALSPATVTQLPASDGGEWLYVAQPIKGAANQLRLLVRLPADAASGQFMRMAALMVMALALAGLALLALVKQVTTYLAGHIAAMGWKGFNPAAKIGHAVSALRDKIRQTFRRPQPPADGDTTVLRAAYSELKHSFAQEAERMRQIVLLDEMSQVLQGCISRAELAELVARCATELFPGSGGALLLKAAPDTVELTHAWGGSAHQEAFSPQDCWALRTGRAHHMQQSGAASCAHMLEKHADCVCLPLMANSEMLGVLHLSRLGGSELDKSIPWAATSLAERTAMAISAVSRQERLQFRATRDALTGLYNRRFMEEALNIEQRRAKRRGSSIGFMMIDVDFFKRFNDTFGHDAGDALLHGIGHILRRTVREGDMPCRYGGEEFVIILPGADLADTRQRAETLRATIERWTPQHQGRSFGQVTTSIGIAAFPLNGDTWQAALKVADQALYRAKNGGRNRVAAPQ